MSMSDVMKEERDTASSTETPSVPPPPPSPPVSSNNNTNNNGHGMASSPSSISKKSFIPNNSSKVAHHHPFQSPYYPHSPPSHRNLVYGRPRSMSLGSPYSNPLLIPQSPPPVMHLGNGRSLSLSPNNAYRRGLEPSLIPVPFMPANSTCSEPPLRMLSDTQKAVEAAMMAERKRAKEMEAEELNMSADELRGVLKRERHRMAKFAGDLARLKSAAVQCQAQAEVLEEGRINGLMRRLESLQIEKGRIINELEQEEEMLTNTLQKKLNEVRREKAQLEKLIEHEMINHSDLKSKLDDIRVNSSSGDDSNGNSSALNQHSSLDALAESPDEEEDDDGGADTENVAMES